MRNKIILPFLLLTLAGCSTSSPSYISASNLSSDISSYTSESSNITSQSVSSSGISSHSVPSGEISKDDFFYLYQVQEAARTSVPKTATVEGTGSLTMLSTKTCTITEEEGNYFITIPVDVSAILDEINGDFGSSSKPTSSSESEKFEIPEELKEYITDDSIKVPVCMKYDSFEDKIDDIVENDKVKYAYSPKSNKTLSVEGNYQGKIEETDVDATLTLKLLKNNFVDSITYKYVDPNSTFKIPHSYGISITYN